MLGKEDFFEGEPGSRGKLTDEIGALYPDLPNARWVALRLLDGDRNIIQAVENGELGALHRQSTAFEGQTLDLGMEMAG